MIASNKIYKKIKKQNGENFAKALRNHHNGLLEIPNIDEILRYAGRDAAPLLPYLSSLLIANKETPAPEKEDPFVLLERAGYNAFHANTLEKQNSIKKYFEEDELLCTFNDHARYQNYHIVHAVKKDVARIKRESFNGKEQRQDKYGTSVISIQIGKNGKFISIKNRYNHTVSGCDNTYNSNPDNIIKGLSAALKSHFSVDFISKGDLTTDGYIVMGGKIIKYNDERNNVYYGDGFWAKDGKIYEVDKSINDAMYDRYIFNSKTRTLRNIDESSLDSFPEDFNKTYGGHKSLIVHKGNLMLGNDILVGAESSQIKSLYLPNLKIMNEWGLCNAMFLESFYAPELVRMSGGNLSYADSLSSFYAPKLNTMEGACLTHINVLRLFHAPELKSMEDWCVSYAESLEAFDAPKLHYLGKGCLYSIGNLQSFHVPQTVVSKACIDHLRTPQYSAHHEYSMTQ